MKKGNKNLVIIFIAINVIFIFLQISKKSNYVKLNYKKQKLEIEKKNLQEEKENLNQQLLELQNPKNIKEFATKHLNLKKMNIKQVKTIKL